MDQIGPTWCERGHKYNPNPAHGTQTNKDGSKMIKMLANQCFHCWNSVKSVCSAVSLFLLSLVLSFGPSHLDALAQARAIKKALGNMIFVG